MSNHTSDIKERLEQFKKSDSAILKTIAKRQGRLTASHSALRADERAVGGKLVENNRRSS